MNQPILCDPSQFPTDEVVFSHIGKTKAMWLSLFEHIHSDHPDLAEEWRYYNDGKSWLLKVTKKAKTVFWLSVAEGSFRTTFYFGDKAEKAILDSVLSDELKKNFRNGKRYGKIRGITVTCSRKSDVEQAKILIALKLACK
jgi:hypothetical protein